MQGGRGLSRRCVAIALAALAAAAAAAAAAPASAGTPPRTTTPIASPAADGPCVFADELLQAELLGEAATQYHRVARGASVARRAHDAHARRRCAADGLRAIETIRHARALGIVTLNRRLRLVDTTTAARLSDAAATGLFAVVPHVVAREIARRDDTAGFAIAHLLLRAHYPHVADEVVTATLASHPEASVPVDLQNLKAAARDRTAREHLAAARGLSRAGLDQEAKSELQKAIEGRPKLRVPPELASPTRREPFWNSWLGTWGPRIVTAAEILAVALAIAVLVLLAVRGLGRFRARMRIEDFTGGPDDTARAATAAAVRENFGRLNDGGGGGRRAKFVTSSAETFAAIPTHLVETFPQLGWITDLVTALGALVPTRARRVTAELRPRDPVRGVGLTIAFGRLHGKVFDEETLWEADYGPLRPAADAQVAYDAVALAAAAWLTFAAARYTLGRSLTRGWLADFFGPSFEPLNVLGTDDWRSYALFAVGADREQAGLRDVAVRCYRRALARDPANRGALFNLIGLDLQATPIVGPERRLALARLEDVRGRTRQTRSLWYRARYLEAVVHLREPEVDADAALAAALDLCVSLFDELALLSRLATVIDPAYRGRRRRNRDGFLRDLRPAALILLASALAAAGGSDGGDDDAPAGEDALARLRAARARRDGRVVDELEQAPALRHGDIVAWAERFRPFRPTTLYVLACYRTRVAERTAQWDDAEQDLRTAIERDPSLGRSALVDDALIDYRRHAGRLLRLERLVGELTAA